MNQSAMETINEEPRRDSDHDRLPSHLKRLIDGATANLTGAITGAIERNYLSTENYLSEKAAVEDLASRACAMASQRSSPGENVGEIGDMAVEVAGGTLLTAYGDDGVDLAVYDDELWSDGIEAGGTRLAAYNDDSLDLVVYDDELWSGGTEVPVLPLSGFWDQLGSSLEGGDFRYDSDDSDERIDDSEKSEHDASLALASKTSQIMANFEDYLSDIKGDSAQGSVPDGALSCVPTKVHDGGREDMEGNRYMKRGSDGDLTAVFLGGAVQVPTKVNDGAREKPEGDRYMRRGSDGDLTAVDLRQAAATAIGSMTFHNYSLEDGSGLEEGNGPSSYSGSEKIRYSQPLLHSKRLKKSVLGVLFFCAACLTVGIWLNRDDSKDGGGDFTHKETMINDELSLIQLESNVEVCEDDPDFTVMVESKTNCTSYVSNAGSISLLEFLCNTPIGIPDENEFQKPLKQFCRKSCGLCDTKASHMGVSEAVIETEAGEIAELMYDIKKETEEINIEKEAQKLEEQKELEESKDTMIYVEHQPATKDAEIIASSEPQGQGPNYSQGDELLSHHVIREPELNNDPLPDPDEVESTADSLIGEAIELSPPNYPPNYPPNIHSEEERGGEPVSITVNLGDEDVEEIYEPRWYHREETSDDGWVGKSYSDAISFCAQQDSQIPCPYEAYCPHGPGSAPTGGYREMRNAWAPIMDVPNGWVNVGSSYDSCELYNSIYLRPPFWGLHGHHSPNEPELDEDVKDITAHIMCCREPTDGKPTSLQTIIPTAVHIATTKYEQDILDKKHPIWYTRKHGYRGTTHEDAANFCASVGDRVLCPHDTYCPQGSGNLPLFLQNDAFSGEQWAPVATADSRSGHMWIIVGQLDGENQSTCAAFGDVKGMKPVGWNVDDAGPDVKENVLCCLDPNHLLKENNYAKDLDPVWLDDSHGWKGGSHQDAEDLCKELHDKKLCPYAAYCPHGPGQPVMGGHAVDFNMEGELWAPAYHSTSHPNYWIMIGQKYQNSATTCMDNWELEGREPSWGLSNENADIKKYIMCCAY